MLYLAQSRHVRRSRIRSDTQMRIKSYLHLLVCVSSDFDLCKLPVPAIGNPTVGVCYLQGSGSVHHLNGMCERNAVIVFGFRGL